MGRNQSAAVAEEHRLRQKNETKIVINLQINECLLHIFLAHAWWRAASRPHCFHCSIFVLTQLLGLGSWITLPLSISLSAVTFPFIDIYFLHLVGNIIFFFKKKRRKLPGLQMFNVWAACPVPHGKKKNNFFLFTPSKGFTSKWKESFPAAYVDKRSATVGTFIKSTPGALITATPRIKQHNTCVTKDTLMGEGHNMLIYTFFGNLSRLNRVEEGKQAESQAAAAAKWTNGQPIINTALCVFLAAASTTACHTLPLTRLQRCFYLCVNLNLFYRLTRCDVIRRFQIHITCVYLRRMNKLFVFDVSLASRSCDIQTQRR